MATNRVIKTVFQFRRATTAEWELNKSVVPAVGEPCFDLDLNTLRIGNGVDTYEDLDPIGGVKVDIDTDGKSIVLNDSVLKLVGFDAAEIGAQPRKAANGSLEWVVPATDTIDGLQTTIAGLKSDINNMQTTITDLRDIVMPSGEEGSGTLLDRVESLENKVGEDDVDAKIDAKINEFATKVSGDGVINTVTEIINYVASHGAEVAAIVKDITDLKVLVGDDTVANQISNAIEPFIKEITVNGKLLDIIDGRVDIDIPEQTVSIKGSDEIEVAEDGTLSIKSISLDKIAQNEDEVFIMDGGTA